MDKPKVGLLPLYLELYDRVLPQMRQRIEGFYGTISSALGERGLDVVTAPVCRLRPEVEKAVESFEEAGADAIVTLHLAYSPSLESAPVVAASRLPLIVLDTTPTFNYAPTQDPTEMLYNHGIHGVQDFCNVLIREGKRFQIEVGHWERSDVLERVVEWARAAQLVSGIRGARVGLIGRQFAGMADFQVPFESLRETIGMEVVQADPREIGQTLPPMDDPEVETEMASDLRRFEAGGVEPVLHRETTRASLAVRKWMEREGLSAFTMNFEDMDRSTGLPTVPFLEASKAMARGQGYAGEGDVLTAALVGALASVYPETTFTEMFCPDWENGTIYLSHMGELNPDLVEGKALLVRKEMAWVDAEPPVVAVGRFRSGGAVFVNLAPGPEGSCTFILAPVKMLDVRGEDKMQDSVRGWFRPEIPLEDFLREYSELGGTHHAALVYGDITDELLRFGDLMGWENVVLEESWDTSALA